MWNSRVSGLGGRPFVFRRRLCYLLWLVADLLLGALSRTGAKREFFLRVPLLKILLLRVRVCLLLRDLMIKIFLLAMLLLGILILSFRLHKLCRWVETCLFVLLPFFALFLRLHEVFVLAFVISFVSLELEIQVLEELWLEELLGCFSCLCSLLCDLFLLLKLQSCLWLLIRDYVHGVCTDYPSFVL